MKRIGLLLVVLSAFLAASDEAAVWADENTQEIPDKALCQTCAARGAVHGEEEVVAWRQFEGAHYYFCSKKCGETFDAFPEAYAPREVPRAAPQMVLSTVNDDALVVGKADGTVVLLDFWATWCGPCIKAIPKLEELQKEFAAEKFSVVGISIDENEERFQQFLRDKKPNYAMVHDSGQEPAWQSFYVVAIPAMVLIDGKGRIVGEWRGEIDLKAVREAIRAHLALAPPGTDAD